MVFDGAFDSFYGVDFSGARLAGVNTWVARLEPTRRRAAPKRLAALAPLGRLAGTAERGPALAHLAGMIAASEGALWALDFPFGLPVELMGGRAAWREQLAFVEGFGEDAYGAGLELVRRSEALGGPKHVRRLTDVEGRAPFDPYHYRIIYQTFYGMRDVAGVLGRTRGTAVLPFQYRRLPSARRVLVEACPASTLKRMGLPHFNYKQTWAGPLDAVRLRARRAILAGLAAHVDISPSQRRTIMRNGGGDALDAVIAAVGAATAWAETDHRLVARHPRYRLEGRMYI